MTMLKNARYHLPRTRLICLRLAGKQLVLVASKQEWSNSFQIILEERHAGVVLWNC